MRTTAELREGFLAYFESKGHKRLPSWPLIPRAEDRSTLLTSAGMQPQMPFFLGLEQPPAPLTTTAQKCFRTPDIDEVGLDGHHLTFFEMLGNFSFGQYFKDGAIEYATEFVREHLKLDWDRLWVTVHAGDPELGLGEDETAITLWEQIGMPRERTAAVVQGVRSVYETDGYQAIMQWIEAESGVAWDADERATKAHRVLADHGRGMTALVGDGVVPSNEGRGYVLRRFEETAAKGDISGEDAFTLTATYGFPVELTRELARERGLEVDEEDFSRLMAEHREISRAGAGRGAARAGGFAQEAGFRTEFVGYEKIEARTQIGALEALDGDLFLCKLRESPFYPEGGGQVTDQGFLEHAESGARAVLREAYRFDDDQALVFEGEGFAAGDRVRALVPWKARFPTMANHTATHLLHKALQEVLGDHVRQAGSAVRPDKLRFDFTHGTALTADERTEVERRVNEKVFENVRLSIFETPLEEARRLGAMMLFGEKYGDVVRVVEIPGYSRELCGGTHVTTTAQVGPFAILSEGSVGSGVRRIEAVTAGEAYALLHERAREAAELRGEIERLRREAKRRPAEAETREDVPAEVRSEGGINVIVQSVDGLDADALLDLSDRY